ncbi:MAG: hypothetical protein R2708_08795 [Vicinamibacterales bacterium]
MRKFLRWATACAVVWTGLATPAEAQLTGCALNGEYVAEGTIVSAPGPAQLSGTFTFLPASCLTGVPGTVVVAITWRMTDGGEQSLTFLDTYLVNDTGVTPGTGVFAASWPPLRATTRARSR